MNIQTVFVIVIAALVLASIALASSAMSQGKRKLPKAAEAGEINEHTTIHELISYDAKIADLLMSYGMHCVGCPSAADEELYQACSVHGLSVEEVLEAVNGYIDGKRV